MLEIPKKLTLLEICEGKKGTFRRQDVEKGEQDHLWEVTDLKASKEELTIAKQELEADIDDKASVGDLQAESEALQSQINTKADATATENAINDLGQEIALKADSADVDSALAEKASKTELNTAKQELQDNIDNIEVSGVSESELNSAIQTSYEKTRMRNENLITNGFGELGNNTNFESWSFDSSDVKPGDTSLGAFKVIGRGLALTNDEFLPVNPIVPYVFSLNYKAKTIDDTASKRFSFGFNYYDSDKRRMYGKNLPAPAMSKSERLDGCILAQDFNTETDLIMYLQAGHAQKWLDRYTQSISQPGGTYYPVRIKSRISSNGRDYGYEYLDYVAWGVWEEADVDLVNDTVTFNTLLSTQSKVGVHVFSAGTRVDSTAYSGTFGWYFHSHVIASNENEWYSMSANISKELDEYAIRPASSFVKLVVLVNYGSSYSLTSEMLFSAVSFKRNSTTPTMVSEQISEERPEADYKNSNLKAEEVPPIPIDKVTDLNNQLTSKASQADLDSTKDDVSNLGVTVSNKANQSDLDTANTNIATKASIIDLSLVTDRDFASEANIVEHNVGSTINTPYDYAHELGLLFIVRTPCYLKSVKLYMKEADDVLVQVYNFEKDTLVSEEMFSLVTGMNKMTISEVLPSGRYYITAISNTTANIGYIQTTEYNANHHFIAVVGGEIEPPSFPDFIPGTTTLWGGFYEMEFEFSTKSLYLGFQSGQLQDIDLIEGAFYQTNKNGYLMTYCYDGSQQIYTV
jgi:hypothetical protein